MSEPTAEPRDAFEDFFKMIQELTWKKVQEIELADPEVYLMIDDTHMTCIVMLMPKQLWRPVVMKMVDQTNAAAYVLVNENWIVTKANNIPGVQPKDNPKSEIGVTVFGYAKDGREKQAYTFLTKDRKIQSDEEIEKKVPKGSKFQNKVIGNVYQTRHMGIAI
jgi:hypothetical protein